MKKKRNIQQEIIKGLEEFTKVLESGEPLEDHFRVTTVERVNAFETITTVKGPGMKEIEKREAEIEALAKAIDWLTARAVGIHVPQSQTVVITKEDWHQFQKTVKEIFSLED